MPDSPLRITMEPTAELVIVGDTMARVWAGRTSGGLEVRVVVFAVASREGSDDAELQRALSSISCPLAPGQVLT